MAKFTGFLDNLSSGILGPKGNMADWQHARRLFIDNNQELAPKSKFLYHVYFQLTESGYGILKELRNFNKEVGMLVKSADLPKYQAQIETKNKYNRKKNIQTSIQYDPVNIEFHDDNYGVTTAFLEAYYKYYFADGNHPFNDGSYGNRRTGDTTYQGPGVNSYKYGLDNNTPVIPFFDYIQITQFARKNYTTYTLINPIITNWAHDNVNSNDGGATTTNTITVAYESVLYDRGTVSDNGVKGFAQEHYDQTPSPISILGGGGSSFFGAGGTLDTAVDIFRYLRGENNFDNPLEAAIAGANLIGNARNLTSEGLRSEGYSILTRALGDVGGTDVSGVAQTFFPKSGGNGGTENLLLATAAIAGTRAVINNSAEQAEVANNPAAAEAQGKQNYSADYQANGGAGGVNDRNAAWDALPESTKARYRGQ